MGNSLTSLVRIGSKTIHSKLRNGSRKYVPTNLDGCVLYLPMAEKSFDLSFDHSGKQNHGTVYGAQECIGRNGNKALHFDGVDDYINIVDCSDFNLGRALTIEIWVKPNGVNRKPIIGRGEAGGGILDWGIELDPTANNKFMFWRENDSDDNFRVRQSDTYTVGQWYHVVAVDDGITFKLYVNGVDRSTYPELNPINYVYRSDRAWRIGVGDYGAAYNHVHCFDGDIGAIKIYNRDLIPEEILAHYEQEK